MQTELIFFAKYLHRAKNRIYICNKFFMVLDFKVERLFVEKQVTFLFLPFSAVRSDGTTSPPQRKNQDKNKPCNPEKPK